jgi:carbonic anhydrase
MNRRRVLSALSGLVLCPTAGLAAEGSDWGYGETNGPERWGELDPANQACILGSQQSPVDIRNAIKAQLPPLRIAWSKKPDTIVNNGHTIQLNFPDGNMIGIGRDHYTLVQLHFHHPSEHYVDGSPLPMEAHFVHRSAGGALAILGVLMRAGKANPTFARIVGAMPEEVGPAVKADPAIDPNRLLPAGYDYYRYAGSLTTPPCSEVVEWFLLADPIDVAAADIETFARLYPMNARPVQKLFRRHLLRS